LFAEAGATGRRGRDPGVVTRAVAGLAEIALERGAHAQALELLDALDADGTRGGRPVRPVDRERLDRCRADVRAARPAGPAVASRGLPSLLAEVRGDAARSGVQPPAAVTSVVPRRARGRDPRLR
jgi:hypothetical protein